MTSKIKATESYPLEYLTKVAKEFQKNLKAKKSKSNQKPSTTQNKTRNK